MMRAISLSFFIVCFFSCNTSVSQKESPLHVEKRQGESVATFAEGCFWHTEIIFQSLEGVRDAVSGYTGGHVENPDYESVCSGETGHAEAVQVYYDSTQISFETLVGAFFSSHDPTTLNRQGYDEGTQYRSIAFYNNSREKEIIEKAIRRINDSKKYKDKIVTEVIPLTVFYPAEEYHQEYVKKNPNNPYVRKVTIPDYLEFKKTFKGRFKETSP